MIAPCSDGVHLGRKVPKPPIREANRRFFGKTTESLYHSCDRKMFILSPYELYYPLVISHSHGIDGPFIEIDGLPSLKIADLSMAM